MSTLVCLKEAGRVVLGSDSRFMNNDFSGIESDAVPKLTRVGTTDAFIATTGWNALCDFHAERVCRLSRELGTDDIRVLADALNRDSGPPLNEVARIIIEQRQIHTRYEETASGASPMQGFILAGRGGGMLGYVFCQYTIRDGHVTGTKEEYFGGHRRFCTTGIQPNVLRDFAKDPSASTDEASVVVRRLLATAKRANPVTIGGPDQIVSIGYDGARWIERLSASETVTAELAHATINASISFTVGSGDQIKFDPATFGATVITGGINRWYWHGAGISGHDTAGATTISLNNLSKSIMLLDGGFEKVFLSAALMEMRINGQKVIGQRGAAITAPTGGTTIDWEARFAINDIINRLKASTGHGLIAG